MLRYEVYDSSGEKQSEFRHLENARGWIRLNWPPNTIYWTDWHQLGPYRVIDVRTSQSSETVFYIIETKDLLHD